MIATGYINSKILIKLINLIVIIIYKFSDQILIQSKSFKRYLLKQTNKEKFSTILTHLKTFFQYYIKKGARKIIN